MNEQQIERVVLDDEPGIYRIGSADQLKSVLYTLSARFHGHQGTAPGWLDS